MSSKFRIISWMVGEILDQRRVAKSKLLDQRWEQMTVHNKAEHWFAELN